MSIASSTIPTVVILHAMGYAGATWVNLVLGSHPDAMSLGPPTRILELPQEDADQACFVHRERCPLWPKFFRREVRHNFFKDLADFTGKRVFIVNYGLGKAFEHELARSNFRVLHIRLVRDGRANLYSYMRHKHVNSPTTAILRWQRPRWDQVDAEMPSNSGDWCLLRYEDMTLDPTRELKHIGQFIGLDYAPNAHRFWEYEHHPTAGNTGVIDTLCQMQGEEGHWHHRKKYYDRIVERLKRNPDGHYLDREWERHLGYEGRLAFDVLLGERNAQLGYKRDSFTEAECTAFLQNMSQTAKYTPKEESTPRGRLEQLWSHLWKR